MQLTLLDLRRNWKPLSYLLVVEIVYARYEFALLKGHHEGNALALGLLLTLATLPTSIASGYVQWYAAEWMGYTAGDTRGLLPRFVAYQVPIVLNFCFLLWLSCRHASAARAGGTKFSGGQRSRDQDT